jgi:Polyketide cyclase / dehydrase and lipid transport
MEPFPGAARLRIPPKSPLGSIRVDQCMTAPAEAVWARIADAGSIADWFPGFSKSYMVGDTWERRVVALSGIETIEDIVNVDGPTRRLQYRIRPNFLVKQHLATVDVIATSDRTCVVTYSTEMEPRALALAISSGTRDALIELKRQVELAYDQSTTSAEPSGTLVAPEERPATNATGKN